MLLPSRLDVRTSVALLAVLLTPAGVAPAAGQTASAAPALTEVVRAGDSVAVFGPRGEVTGRVVRVSAASLTIESERVTRVIALEDIGWIERVGDSILEGVAIGGGAFGAFFGALDAEGCQGDCRRRAIRGALIGIAVGASLGGFIDAAFVERRVVFGTPRAAMTPAPDAEALAPTRNPQPSPPDAVGAPALRDERAASPADLWRHVRPGERIVIDLTDKKRVRGAFERATADQLTVARGDTQYEIPAASVARVSRVGSRAQMGMAIGATTCVLSALVSRSEHGSAFAGALFCGLAGGAIGRFIPTTTTVYETPALSTVRTPAAPRRPPIIVVPVIDPHTAGLVAMVSW
jgi:hypothetical protein